MERDCYGEVEALFELVKRENVFLMSELIHKKKKKRKKKRKKEKKKPLIVQRRLNLNNEKLFRKYIKEICKFLAYENKN